jgi:nitrous oxidase accessory protein NosD
MDPRPVLVGLLVVLLVAAAAFVPQVGGDAGGSYDPVAFEDTVKLGLTDAAAVEVRASNRTVPQGQVFYSQYRYVVGYYGVEALVSDLQRPGRERQVGRPLAVFVTAYEGTELRVNDDDELYIPSTTPATVSWVPADSATYVVGSEARTPAGEVVVPFQTAAAAREFADAHGGRVLGWDAVRDLDLPGIEATRDRMRTAVAERTGWADRQSAAAHALLDRPVSVVVGEDAPTLAAAVEQASPNTTVRLPPGTYEANVTVSKPLTLRGAGNDTHLLGDGNGSVVRVHSPGVAVADLRVTGVGNSTSPDVRPEDTGEWDYAVQMGYGYGDAAVSVVESDGVLVSNVWTRTPANGVLVRDSDGVVVANVTVVGSGEWQDGFMGVMSMRARPVVQDSTFVGGRDGVYMHLSDGLVVRDSRMVGMRFGVHEMYSSDILVANNTVRETDVGLITMTRPRGNALVDNDVRESGAGIAISGSATYVAGNVLVDNRYGLQIPSETSLYEHNVVAYNEIGVRATALLPSNTVVANDFVGNDRPVVAPLGPLRVWTVDGEGNYWDTAPGRDRDGDGTLERAYRPTGAVDGRVGRVPGAETLARSPAVAGLRTLQEAVPGLRSRGAVDLAPSVSPGRPTVVERLNATRPEPSTARDVTTDRTLDPQP